MRRAAALSLAAACAGAAPPVAVPAASLASALPLATAPEAEAASPPPLAPSEVTYEGARAVRLGRATALARGAYDAFANVAPAPVVRGYAERTYVQFETDRRERGVFSLVEAATTALHHPLERATKVEPCARPLAEGGEARMRGGRARLVRGRDHDELRFGDGAKSFPAKLPRGAAHGACVGPDETRIWISWSTPTTPAELFSVSQKDGTVRPLRIDARPGLAALDEVRTSSLDLGGSESAAVLEPTNASSTAVLIDDGEAPLARWNPFARFLAGAGVRVLVARSAGARAAAERGSSFGRSTVITRGAGGAPAGGRVIVLAEEAAALGGDLSSAALVIASGDGLADEARTAAARAGAPVSLAPGTAARDVVPAAWARALDAVLEPAF